MESKEVSSGNVVKDIKPPESFSFAPRIENTNPNPNLDHSSGPVVTSSPATMGSEAKKKRGRPRKYGPDGSVAAALSPMPISSSIPSPMPISSSLPLTGDMPVWTGGRGKLLESTKKQQKFEYKSPPGEGIACFVGANFTPHILTVNAGEDVTMKIMTFSQQGAHAICILSANGTISNVTLRQPTSSGGTLTYEGRFEILSLSGSFMPTENGGTKGRSGGMSVTLAGPDGRVMGGGLAGLLVAAGPVQVVVASFLPGHQLEPKPKKPRVEASPYITPTSVTHITAEELKGMYGGVKPIPVPSSFQGDNSASLDPMQVFGDLSNDNKSSSPENGDSKGQEQYNCEVSC